MSRFNIPFSFAKGCRALDVPASLLAPAGAVLLAAAPSLPVSVLALALTAAGIALRPALGLSLLGLSLPFYLLPRKLGPVALSMPEMILLCSVIGTALHAAGRWKHARRAAGLATPLDWPIALFLGAALLSLLASEVMRVSLRDLRTLVVEPVLAYYLVAWFVRGRAELMLLLAGLLLGATAAAGLGIYQYLFTDHVIAVEGARRILGPYSSPNQMALYLGRLLPMAMAIALYLPGLRLAATGAAAVLAVGLLLTFSLGGWLAGLLAVAAVLLLRWSRTLAVMAGVIVAAIVAAVPLLSLERVSSHFDLTRGTSFLRLQLWEASLRMVGDHPLLGVGMDNFLYRYRGGYIPPGAVEEPNLSHPHNLVLNFWLQLGILGLLAAVWLAVALLRMWRRLWLAPASASSRAVLAGIAGAGVDLLAHGLIDNSYFLVDLAFHFWILAGLLVALRRLELSPLRQI